MFDKFTFLKDRQFGQYFGFTKEEVLKLCERGELDFKELESWYNGYITAKGIKYIWIMTLLLSKVIYYFVAFFRFSNLLFSKIEKYISKIEIIQGGIEYE